MRIMKLKHQVKKTYNGSDVYKFIGGIARVPGCRYKGRPMTITFKEFKELI